MKGLVLSIEISMVILHRDASGEWLSLSTRRASVAHGDRFTLEPSCPLHMRAGKIRWLADLSGYADFSTSSAANSAELFFHRGKQLNAAPRCAMKNGKPALALFSAPTMERRKGGLDIHKTKDARACGGVRSAKRG